ncbi:MAG: hypothetical protein Q9188_002168 [Gyalolechia gomerana]
MPCQQLYAELMADSLPCHFGPFANYGAIGQPVIIPPESPEPWPLQTTSTLIKPASSSCSMARIIGRQSSLASNKHTRCEPRWLQATATEAMNTSPPALSSSTSTSPHSNAATTHSSPPTSASSSFTEAQAAAHHQRLFAAKLAAEDPAELRSLARAAEERERKLPWMTCSVKHLVRSIEHWKVQKGRGDIGERERQEAADKASELQQYFEERKYVVGV